MASAKPSAGPASFAEGMNMVVQAVTATMTAPDAQQHLPLLQQLLQAAVGSLHATKPPAAGQGQAPMGAQPGATPAGGAPGGMGGGTSLGQLMGQGQQPPAGPSQSSTSGVSADDLRRAIAAQAGTAA